MKKRCTFLKEVMLGGLIQVLLLVISLYISYSQVSINTYTRTTFTGTYTSIKGSSGPSGDDNSINYTLPFAFQYVGFNYNQVRICTNGWIELGSVSQPLSSSNEVENSKLFATEVPMKVIAPWWDDLATSWDGYIQYTTLGYFPNRVFVVEWNNVLSYYAGSSRNINFQVRLYETSNVIEFWYGSAIGKGSSKESASFGIKDTLGGTGHFIDGPTKSTTIGTTTLTTTENWPTVFYRFSPQPIQIERPNGGECFYVGLTDTISWVSSSITNVKLEYSTDAGASWLIISTSMPASTSRYNWLIPNAPTNQAKIRISDVSNASIFDMSDTVFTIQQFPSIKVAPGSLFEALNVGDSTLRKLSINNIGAGELRFNVTVGYHASSKLYESFAKKTGHPTMSMDSIETGADYKPDRVIVKFKKGISSVQIKSLCSDLHATVTKKFTTIGAELWDLSGMSVADAIAQAKDNPLIEYIEPDYVVHTYDKIPNDPSFSQLWGMKKIDAPKAWDRTTGTNVVIGIIDTGIDTSHVDLSANIWKNPGEIPGNGIDDDGNGYIDDVYGWDFYNNDNDPFDDYGHGTHVAGTIAAVGNNNIGVVGVCWSAKLMAVKFLGASGSGYTSGAISALEYATMMHARLTNNSWGGGTYSRSLYDAIKAAGDAGSLFIVAAGNNANNTDIYPAYPASYDLENILSVASTTSSDNLSYFSNYGPTSVDLGAPGSDIYSTLPRNMYGTYSGTSMAAPHVSGTAGLILSLNPYLGWAEVKNTILTSVDLISPLTGITVSGGRLNAAEALKRTQTWLKVNPLSGSVPPGTSSDLDVTLNAKEIIGGDYTATVYVTNNDPSNSIVRIPTSIHVVGTPNIVFAYDSLDLGDVFVNYTKNNSLDVRNTGSDSLVVYNIISSNPAFTISPNNFIIPVKGEQQFTLSFTATDTGEYHGLLTIISNDSDQSNLIVPFRGRGIFPPDITVDPDSFVVSMNEGDSTTRTMAIGNAGNGDLHWSIRNAGNLSLKQKIAEGLQIYHLSTPTQVMEGNPDVSNIKGTMVTTNRSQGQTSLPKRFNYSFSDLGGVRILFDNGHLNYGDTSVFSIMLSDFRSRGAKVEVNTGIFSLALLNNYDIVIVTEGDGIYTTDELTALQTWAHNGGGLLIEGDSFSGNFASLTLSYGIQYTGFYGTWGYTKNIISHEVTAGCGTIYLPGPVNSLRVSDGAKLIVNDISGNGHVAVSSYGAGHVMVVADDDFYGSLILEADNRKLANNGADWLAGGRNWWTVAPDSGVVAPGGIQDVVVKFNSKNLISGDYNTVIPIKNDDLQHNPKNVSVNLHVAGRPRIVIKPDSLDFGSVFVNTDKIDTIIIQNTGSLLLNAKSISSNNPVFLADLTFAQIPPHSEQIMLVKFTPSDTISYTGALTIISNDSSHLEMIVGVRGCGVYPPSITVSPDSFTVSVGEGDSTARTMTIGNTGLGELIWNINIPNSISQSSNLQKKSSPRTPQEVEAIKASQTMEENINNTGTQTISPYSWQQFLAGIGGKKILAWVGYSDRSAGGEFENTINAISQYYTDFTLDTTTTTSLSVLSSLLNDKDIFLIPEQEQAYNLTFLGSAFSSVLTSFVQNGRTIIVLDYSYSGATTFLNGTGLLSITNVVLDDGIAVINDTTSYLVKNLPSTFMTLNGSNYHNSPDGRNVIRDQSTGNNRVTAKDVGSGSVIYIGMDFYSYNDAMARLIANAVEFATSANFLSGNPTNGTVTPGSTQDIIIKLNGKMLSAGNYKSNIVISSNDPVNNPRTVPVHLHVSGKPVISVRPDSIDFGSGFITSLKTDTLLVKNLGSDALVVNNILSSNPVFSVNQTNFTVQAHSVQAVVVTFAPMDSVKYTGILTVRSNDSSHLGVSVRVIGHGAYPPNITVSPDSFTVSVGERDSTTCAMTIGNIGVGELNWNIDYLHVAGLTPTSVKSNMLDWSNSNELASSKQGTWNNNVSNSSQKQIRLFSSKRTVIPKILLLAADNLNNMNSTKSALIATGLFTSSDIDILSYPTTISLSDLKPYNAILVWTNGNFNNAQVIGNVLKEYVDAGGGVVLATYAYSIGWAIQGGILDGNYSPFTPSSTQSVSGIIDMGSITVSSHPIFANISTAPTYWSNNNYSNPLLNIGGRLLARDTYGNNVVADNPSGQVVGIVVFPSNLSLSNAETKLMFANALNYVSFPMKWLAVSPNKGVIASGMTQDISLKFNTDNLSIGDYRTNIVIHSNDPVHPAVSIPVHFVVVTSVDGNEKGIPSEYALKQNHPNPFNPATQIKYALPRSEHITLKIYDILGREVMILVNEFQEVGYKSVSFNANDLPSGIYFYRMQAGKFSDIKKMLLIR